MKKHVLNLYESSLPLANTNNLWVDIDENTNSIKAIHKYNKSKGEWEPHLISAEYLLGDDTGNKPNNDSGVLDSLPYLVLDKKAVKVFVPENQKTVLIVSDVFTDDSLVLASVSSQSDYPLKKLSYNNLAHFYENDAGYELYDGICMIPFNSPTGSGTISYKLIGTPYWEKMKANYLNNNIDIKEVTPVLCSFVFKHKSISIEPGGGDDFD